MKKREKRPVLTPASLEAAEQIMSEYAQADAKLAEITAKMDQRITTIREEFAEELQALGTLRDDRFKAMQLFAERNHDYFMFKKSFEMAHGIIGFRTGTPKLKLMKGFTWSAVGNLLKQFLPSYLRIVEEPAKDKLLADRNDPTVNRFFNRDGIGVEVVQEETFFIDLKKEGFASADAAA